MSGDPRLPRVPAQLQAYVDVLGIDGTVAFLLEFGGAEIYLTTAPKSRSRVVKLVGREKAIALARLQDRLQARVPLVKPWIAAVMFARGLSKAEIARRLHVTDVTVRNWLKAGGRDGKSPRAPGQGPEQLSLF